MLRLVLTPDAALRTPTIADVEALHLLIAESAAHLAPWMPWAGQGPVATRTFVRDARLQAAAGTGLQLLLEDAAGIGGCVGLHGVDRRNGVAGIGWWVAPSREGTGRAAHACSALLAHGFDVLDLHRVEVGIAPGNHRSRALALRLGFRPEGVRREAEAHAGGHRDLELLGLLGHERDLRRVPRATTAGHPRPTASAAHPGGP